MAWEIVPQDEAWVDGAKRNLTALYEGGPLERMPFEWLECRVSGAFEPAPGDQGAGAPGQRSVEDARRDLFDHESRLREQLAALAGRVRQGFRDDNVRSLRPVTSIGWMAEVFGARVRWFADRPSFPEPVVRKARDIDGLRPDFSRGELYRHALGQMRFFRGVVGGRIPVGPPDLQSPTDVASMVMDYMQLIYAMLDEPGRVHALLRMITDATIESCHAFRKEMVTDHPLSPTDWWMPRGIFLADDLMAVLSPELYREFSVPYNEALAEEFGGLGLHSCGRILQNLENVAQTKGILALNTHECLSDVAAVVKDRLVVITGWVFETGVDTYPGSRRGSLGTPEELERFWWEDSARLPEVRGQRSLYQSHALLHSHTADEAYRRTLELCREAAVHLGREP